MNKLLIILLAVCLVSVHAFVKRDAPEAAKADPFEELKKNIETFGNQLNEGVKKAFDPDTMKQNVNEFLETINTQINKLKQSGAAPKE